MRLTLLLLVALPATVAAQSLDLTVNNTGISIGDSRVVHGLRLNFRDRNMQRVDGINATIWAPYDNARGGTVKGFAIGLPVTGADEISGIGVGVFGVGTEERFTGLGLGGIGVGGGSDLRGIMIGGIGVGSGGRVEGLSIGGIGVGSGGGVRGVSLAGIGVGSGGDVEGLSVALIGVGGGGNIRGISFGGVGVGGGGDITGLQGAVVGVGGGGDITGISIAGVGVGGGGTVRGLAIGGIGVGAPRIRAIAAGLMVGGHDVAGVILAPAYFRLESNDAAGTGRVSGVTISAFNQVMGDQHGLSLGLLNYAWSANGLQLGLINYVADNPKGLRLLPLINRSWK